MAEAAARKMDTTEAVAAWNKVLAAEDNSWMIFNLPESWMVKKFDVTESQKGNASILGLNNILKDRSAKGVPCWGCIKVLTKYEEGKSTDSKPGPRTVPGAHLPIESSKIIAFDLLPPNCKGIQKRHNTEVKEIAREVFTKYDHMIETDNRHDVGDTNTIAKTLRKTCKDQYYDFGANKVERTDNPSLIIQVDAKRKIEMFDALDAWENLLSTVTDHSYVVYGLNDKRDKLEVLAMGKTPGMASCGAAVEELVQHSKPVWGCFVVKGNDEAAMSSRNKYVGFQIIPSSVKPMARELVRWVKPLLTKNLHHATTWIETDCIEDIVDEANIIKLLNKNSGSNAASSYDFGGPLNPKDEETIKLYIHQLECPQTVEEELKEREANIKKADELESQEIKRRMSQPKIAPAEEEKKVLTSVLAQLTSDDGKEKVDLMERAARKRTVQAQCEREQEEQVLTKKLENKALEDEREENRHEADKAVDEEAVRRDKEEPHMPADLPEDKKRDLATICAAVQEATAG